MSLRFASIRCFPKFVQTQHIDNYGQFVSNTDTFSNNVVYHFTISGCGRLGALVCPKISINNRYIQIDINFHIDPKIIMDINIDIDIDIDNDISYLLKLPILLFFAI